MAPKPAAPKADSKKRELEGAAGGPEAKKKVVAAVAGSQWDRQLPPPDAPCDARPTMQHVVQDVHTELSHVLHEAVGNTNTEHVSKYLWEVQPLQIKERLKSGELSTFKSPWTSEQCKAAIATTGLYEAGCNILWIDALGAHAMPFDIPVTLPSWATVHEVYERCFGPSASGLGGVTLGGATRLCFPTTLPAFVVDEKVLQAKSLNCDLFLTGGHALVFAWYLAAWHAIKSKDFPYLLRVWECGLTVSVRVRLAHATDPRLVLLDSWSFSEAVQVAQVAGSDSFVVFAAKLASFTKHEKSLAAGGKVTQESVVNRLATQGVRYRGAMLNGMMFKMANSVHAGLTAECLERVQVLEWKYGPELLSTSYNKLGRLIQTCQKAAERMPAHKPDVLVRFVLDMMDFSVERRLVKNAKFFTMDACDKQKDGSQGWFGLTVNKCKVFLFLLGPFLENLRRSNEALCKVLESDVVPTFQDPGAVLLSYGKGEDSGEGSDGADALSPVPNSTATSCCTSSMAYSTFASRLHPWRPPGATCSPRIQTTSTKSRNFKRRTAPCSELRPLWPSSTSPAPLPHRGV
jgi:hypothetical protein